MDSMVNKSVDVESERVDWLLIRLDVSTRHRQSTGTLIIRLAESSLTGFI